MKPWMQAIWRESHREEHASLLALLHWLEAINRLKTYGYPIHLKGRE